MPVIGTPRSFAKKFKFLVEVEGFDGDRIAFQKMSELSVELAEVAYSEGGSLIPDKSPGRLTFADVTFERGVVNSDLDMYNWMLETADAASNAGLASPLYKRNMSVIQLERDNSELRRWNLFNCWPKKVTVVDGFDNEADENVIEMLTIAYDFFELG
jgi:phage tail-like protein